MPDAVERAQRVDTDHGWVSGYERGKIKRSSSSAPIERMFAWGSSAR
jgi:hypothetical protein